MITVLNAAQLIEYPQLAHAMFTMRRETFFDRLQWDVEVKDGLEIDDFDRKASPLYLLAMDHDSTLRGSLRLLPTTGPTMLSDVFSELLDGEPAIASPLIWESTRFCASAAAAQERSENQLNRTTGELLAGIVEVGQKAGLMSVISVYDAIMKRVLERAGCPADIVGTPKKIGKVTTYAGLFAIDDDMLGRIRHAAGLSGSVLQSETVERALAA